MRYQFIEIRETREGQMAYLLDTKRGVVIVAPVEMSGFEEDSPEVRSYELEDNIDRAPYRPRQRSVVRPAARRVPGLDVLTAEDVDDLPSPEEFRARRAPRIDASDEDAKEKVIPAMETIPQPLPKRRSIMPPEHRGIFTKPGRPGAAVESREAL